MKITNIKDLNLKEIENKVWFRVVRRANSPLFESILRVGGFYKK